MILLKKIFLKKKKKSVQRAKVKGTKIEKNEKNEKTFQKQNEKEIISKRGDEKKARQL